MPRHLVMVGTGDYWKGLVKPSLEVLTAQGLISGVTTVDVEKDPESPDHIVRDDGQPLSEIVDSLEQEEPYVLLSHPNQLHTLDAEEVLENAKSNPRILIEKPYAINEMQFNDLGGLLTEHPQRIALLEYYLKMKGVPLLVFGGAIKPASFYFDDNGILKVRSEGHNKRTFNDQFETMMGKPLFVVSDVLEGEGSYGTVAHRNLSLVDTRLGGGMIQDLGLHALTPLMGLEHSIGTIDVSNLQGIRVAYCEEYKAAAKERGVPEEYVGESYAELDLCTGKNVPVRVRLGKYVENGQNQRRIIIVGTRGTVLYDMTNNVLAFQRGDKTDGVTPLLESDKTVKVVPKYL